MEENMQEKLEEIAKEYPTPFHLYDEKGIRENAREFRRRRETSEGGRRESSNST